MLLGVITHVKTKSPVATLTFDDGPNPEYTPHLLDMLSAHQAKATFFVVGEIAEKYPKIIDDILLAGHEIACHSWSHASYPTLTRRERTEEIRKCEKSLNGKLTKYFRPPYGHLNFWSYVDVRLLGYRIVTWNISPNDWLDHDANWMADKVKRKLKPGSIILLHDSLYTYSDHRYINRSPTIEAVELILQAHTPQYQFVTLTELINAGKPQFNKWIMLPEEQWLNEQKKTNE